MMSHGIIATIRIITFAGGSRYMAVAGGYMKRVRGYNCHGSALPGRSTFLS
jgi:hypothetical protein